MLAAIKAESIAQTAPACRSVPFGRSAQTAHGQRIIGRIRRYGFTGSLTLPDSGSMLAARALPPIAAASGPLALLDRNAQIKPIWCIANSRSVTETARMPT